MTNLSELLPSGGGAKEFDAVASGTLPNGQAVIMRSDGKVEAVGPSGGGVSLGTAKEFDQGNNFYFASFYDTNTDQTAIFYTDDTSNTYYGTACSAKVSGTTMTVGTPQVFSTAITYFICCAFDERTTGGTDTGLVAYRGASNYGRCKAAYIASNGTIQFGGNNTFYSGTANSTMDMCWAPDANCFAIGYKAGTTEGRVRIVYPTSLGNITLGQESVFASANVRAISMAPAVSNSSTSCNVLVTFRNPSSSYARQAIIGTTTQNSITFSGSTTYTWENTYGTEPARTASVDYANGKVVIAYTPADTGANSIGRCLVATVSGTAISFGSPVNFTLNQESYHIWVAPTGTTNEFLITFADGSYSGGPGTAIIGTVSGTTPSYSGIAGGGSGTVYIFTGNTGGSAQFTHSSYDSDANAMIITYANGNFAGDPNEVLPFFMDSSNSANFIGITSQAIANGATGKVNPQGGVATASSPSSGEAGTAVVFTGNIASNDTVAVFDSSSNQVVIGFQNASTGGGQAIVADITASTNAVTLGSAGSYQSAGGASYNAITYDASANKIVSICSALASPYQGVAYVGTVSGTSISYTGAVNFNGTENYQGGDLTYDSSNNVTVASFERNDSGSNKHGASVVGTISGGAITFGTASDFAPSTNIQYANNTFDSNSNKVVTVFQNSNTGYGNAVVSTVSGTTISHGSLGVLTQNGVEMGTGGTICFDSTNNKVIAPYRNTTDSKGYVRIGTVSGTTITFGNAVEFDSAPGGQSIRSVYDSNLNKVIIFYTNASNYPTVRTGTVSGTSIVLDDAFIVATTSVTTDMSCAAAFDSSENRTLLSYKPSATGLGNAQVYLTAGTAQDLIVGSTYYVQNNGNLSTTSSSVTAGKAISTTQLILNGAS